MKSEVGVNNSYIIDIRKINRIINNCINGIANTITNLSIFKNIKDTLDFEISI